MDEAVKRLKSICCHYVDTVKACLATPQNSEREKRLEASANLPNTLAASP